MNSTDLLLEHFYNEKITHFNFVFTTIAGAITAFIAPFYLFIILTQSKSLGTYRFFLLNHSIWTICAELALSLTKPCFLMPGAGGFVLGPLGKIGNSTMSCYFIFADCLFILFTIVGMTMSLTYRYTSIFPGRVKKIGTSRWMMFTFLVLQSIVGILICIIVGKFFSLDRDTMDKIAIDFSPVLSKFTKEPTFVIVDREFMFFIIIIMWIILVIVSILSIIVVMALLFELSRYSYTVSVQECERTLILSCAAQVGITFMFLFIPVMVLLYYLTFGYIYGGPTMMIFGCIFSLHAIMEMLVTTYFVLPYRRFVKRGF
ncbi:hypothetical protein FO519_009738, partial [Halicephalobus sp. NKZ332]